MPQNVVSSGVKNTVVNTVAPQPKNVVVSELTVSNKVLELIGNVPNFKTIKAIRIIDNNFRVNVYCQKPGGSDFFVNAYIAHSYFISTDTDGNITNYYADKGSIPLKILQMENNIAVCDKENV